jgi:ribosomal protein S18 acetylase RimI-like enzyme
MTEQTANNITIKQLTLADANLVTGLFNQYRIFYKQFSDIGMAKAFIEARLENNDSVIFLAFAKDQPVGFTQLYPIYSSVRLSKNWILNDLFVDVNYRNQGIGELLIKTAMGFAKKQGSTFVQLETAVDNHIAQSLYESIGFKQKENDTEFFLYRIEIK